MLFVGVLPIGMTRGDWLISGGVSRLASQSLDTVRWKTMKRAPPLTRRAEGGCGVIIAPDALKRLPSRFMGLGWLFLCNNFPRGAQIIVRIKKIKKSNLKQASENLTGVCFRGGHKSWQAQRNIPVPVLWASG